MAEPDQLQFVADERMNTELNVEKKWVGEQVKAALDDLNEDQKKSSNGFTIRDIRIRRYRTCTPSLWGPLKVVFG